MHSNRITILGINPGTRYIGFAVLKRSVLIDWGVSVVNGSASRSQLRNARAIVSGLVAQYDVGIVSLKKLHPSRRSVTLQSIANSIGKDADVQGLQVCRYSIQEIEKFISPDKRINKRQLAELIRHHHTALRHALYKEQDNLNPYHIRMFEAVALAMLAAGEKH